MRTSRLAISLAVALAAAATVPATATAAARLRAPIFRIAVEGVTRITWDHERAEQPGGDDCGGREYLETHGTEETRWSGVTRQARVVHRAGEPPDLYVKFRGEGWIDRRQRRIESKVPGTCFDASYVRVDWGGRLFTSCGRERLSFVELTVFNAPDGGLYVGNARHWGDRTFHDCSPFDDPDAYLRDRAPLTFRELLTKRRLVLRGADRDESRVGAERWTTSVRWTATLTRIGWTRGA